MPLLVPPTANFAFRGAAMVWVIIAMSTSSSLPSLMNSGLPPRNSMPPALRSSSRYSISMYSSEGTASRATRPERACITPGTCSPIAAAIIEPIWQW